jgi:hypothetical protein
MEMDTAAHAFAELMTPGGDRRSRSATNNAGTMHILEAAPRMTVMKPRSRGVALDRRC